MLIFEDLRGVSMSLLTAYFNCRAYCKFRLDGWKGLRPKAALQFGDFGHIFLENMYKYVQKSGKMPTDRWIKTNVDRLAVKYRKENGERWSANEVEDFELRALQLQVVMEAYVVFYAKDAKLRWLGLEEYINVKADGIPGKLTAKIDGIIEKRRQPWIWENKFLAQISDEMFGSVLAADLQVNLYKLIYRAEYGKTARGIVYNVIRRPGLKLRQNDTLPQYAERLGEHIAADPSHYFRRVEQILTPEMDADFHGELFRMVLEFKDWIDSGMPHFKFGMPCRGKFGLCDYLDLCQDGDESLFTQNTKKKGTKRGCSKEGKIKRIKKIRKVKKIRRV